MKSRNIWEPLLLLSGPVLSGFTILVLLRLGNFRDPRHSKIAIFFYIGIILLLLSALFYGFLYIKTQKMAPNAKKMKLTIDRWHTVYPGLVLGIVLFVIISFPCIAISMYATNGRTGVVITTLFYIIAWQIIDIFP